MLCIWWDQFDVVYYELLKPNEIITGAFYRTQLMRLSRVHKDKRGHYYSRHDKVILLRDNTRPHVAAPVKTYLETLRIHQTLLLLITTHFDRWHITCLSNTSHHMKTPKIGPIRGYLQKLKRSSDEVSAWCQKDGKK